MAEFDKLRWEMRVAEMLHRQPAVGMAVGVVRNGALQFFSAHGVADVPSRVPVTDDTVFRVGSITKTMTAIAAMQLVEQGLLDLDAPANDYLRAYRLAPPKPGWRPATVRHLLTHTAGIAVCDYFVTFLAASFAFSPCCLSPALRCSAFPSALSRLLPVTVPTVSLTCPLAFSPACLAFFAPAITTSLLLRAELALHRLHGMPHLHEAQPQSAAGIQTLVIRPSDEDPHEEGADMAVRGDVRHRRHPARPHGSTQSVRCAARRRRSP